MTTFVLVHGAWHGGWCWRKVVPLLRAQGHQVLTPTLTGLGERAHLVQPSLGLDVHVDDLVNTFRFEELADVVLVGHSYASLVISQAAAQLRDRLRHLVYVDAGIPTDGQTGFDVLGPEVAARLTTAAEQGGDGWLIPPVDAHRLGIEDPDDAAWVQRHLVPHPLKTYRQPLSLVTLEAAPIPRTLINCSRQGPPPEGVRVVRLRAAHDVMVTEPAALAAALEDV